MRRLPQMRQCHSRRLHSPNNRSPGASAHRGALPHPPMALVRLLHQQTHPGVAPRQHEPLGHTAPHQSQADERQIQRRHPTRQLGAESSLQRNVHRESQHARALLSKQPQHKQ